LREWENDNIPQDTISKHNERNAASPTLQHMNERSMNISNNRNSQITDTSAEFSRYSGDIKWESTSSAEKKLSCNLRNEHNW
jgi:hypothetical protein